MLAALRGYGCDRGLRVRVHRGRHRFGAPLRRPLSSFRLLRQHDRLLGRGCGRGRCDCGRGTTQRLQYHTNLNPRNISEIIEKELRNIARTLEKKQANDVDTKTDAADDEYQT
jgi:hypothetical protein